jgi:hypothetical protein
MSDTYWWLMEEQARTIMSERLREAERDRSARQVARRAKPVRTQVAATLRVVAGWLDGEARPRELAAAR